MRLRRSAASRDEAAGFSVLLLSVSFLELALLLAVQLWHTSSTKQSCGSGLEQGPPSAAAPAPPPVTSSVAMEGQLKRWKWPSLRSSTAKGEYSSADAIRASQRS